MASLSAQLGPIRPTRRLCELESLSYGTKLGGCTHITHQLDTCSGCEVFHISATIVISPQ